MAKSEPFINMSIRYDLTFDVSAGCGLTKKQAEAMMIEFEARMTALMDAMQTKYGIPCKADIKHPQFWQGEES